jgi:Lipocalin-like domain
MFSSGSQSDLLGANPVGYINYAPDGRMMVINVGGERPKPAAGSATSTEAEALFRSMTSYAGTYTIDGHEITHHVDVSWHESWTGTRQKRFARFEGNRVYLSSPPSPDPVTGAMSVRTMTWEKGDRRGGASGDQGHCSCVKIRAIPSMMLS